MCFSIYIHFLHKHTYTFTCIFSHICFIYALQANGTPLSAPRDKSVEVETETAEIGQDVRTPHPDQPVAEGDGSNSNSGSESHPQKPETEELLKNPPESESKANMGLLRL